MEQTPGTSGINTKKKTSLFSNPFARFQKAHHENTLQEIDQDTSQAGQQIQKDTQSEVK
jgi:hypothetical protein